MRRKERLDEETAIIGLAGYRGEPAPMRRAHRHNEVEINYLERGTISYQFGGTPVELSAGHLALFWAAVPHRLAAIEPGTVLCWLTIPLGLFLSWRLPEALTDRVLRGRPIAARDEARRLLDGLLVHQWLDDLSGRVPERRAIALREIEARCRRLALATARPGDEAARAAPVAGGAVERMAAFIATQHAEPIRIADAARAANLQPSQAMYLFRRDLGMSIGAYLTQHRVAAAQRLLATTELGALEVALESGFGSLSRFYVAFRRACGCSPHQYRAALRSPFGWRADQRALD